MEALKGEDFTQDGLRLFTKAFRSLMESCLSADLLRSLALFITYALHKPKAPTKLQKKKSIRLNSSPQLSTSSSGKREYVSSSAMAVEMLRMYSSVLCNVHDLLSLTKFARAVTNKVGFINTPPLLVRSWSLIRVCAVAFVSHMRG